MRSVLLGGCHTPQGPSAIHPRENCLLTIARTSIPVYHADGTRVMLGLRAIKILKEAHRFARVVQRKRDGAITRGYLTALPGEIGTRITAAPTVVRVLPQTWTHATSLKAGL